MNTKKKGGLAPGCIVLLVLSAVFGITVIGAIMVGEWSKYSARKQAVNRQQEKIDQQKKQKEEFNTMSSAEHLLAMKQIDAVAKAKEHLNAIPKSSSEYKEGELILIEIEKQTEKQNQERLQKQKESEIAKREVFAPLLEQTLLRTMKMDTTVTVEGKEKDILRIKYALMGRVMAETLCNDAKLCQQCQEMKFKKLICQNKIDWSYWSYDF